MASTSGCPRDAGVAGGLEGSLLWSTSFVASGKDSPKAFSRQFINTGSKRRSLILPRRLYFFITKWRTGSGVRGENTCHTGLRASENSQLSTSALGSVPASDESDVDLGRGGWGAGGLGGWSDTPRTLRPSASLNPKAHFPISQCGPRFQTLGLSVFSMQRRKSQNTSLRIQKGSESHECGGVLASGCISVSIHAGWEARPGEAGRSVGDWDFQCSAPRRLSPICRLALPSVTPQLDEHVFPFVSLQPCGAKPK